MPELRQIAVPMSGLLNLNKPVGVTSRDVVNRVSRPLHKVKVGHAGTLDPLASGVLVVCVGAATRLIEYVQRMRKTYRATVRLGATSDTLDADGIVVEAIHPPIPSEGEVREALSSQIGTIEQIPPQFSALKVGGERAYKLARAGIEVNLSARPITVHRIDIISYEWPFLEIEVECGGGTYIRSIARDVGEQLGCGGLISTLERTKIGPFSVDYAIDPGSLTRDTISTQLLPTMEAVCELPGRVISSEDVGRIVQGREIVASDAQIGEVALVGPDGELVAIAEARGEQLFPRRVLVGGV